MGEIFYEHSADWEKTLNSTALSIEIAVHSAVLPQTRRVTPRLWQRRTSHSNVPRWTWQWLWGMGRRSAQRYSVSAWPEHRCWELPKHNMSFNSSVFLIANYIVFTNIASLLSSWTESKGYLAQLTRQAFPNPVRLRDEHMPYPKPDLG